MLFSSCWIEGCQFVKVVLVAPKWLITKQYITASVLLNYLIFIMWVVYVMNNYTDDYNRPCLNDFWFNFLLIRLILNTSLTIEVLITCEKILSFFRKNWLSGNSSRYRWLLCINGVTSWESIVLRNNFSVKGYITDNT